MKRCWLLPLLGLWSGALAATEATSPRVVTLAPHLAELICAAGACERLVAVADYTDTPAEVLDLPRIGDAFRVSLETLVALRPTHVITWDGGTPPERVARLRGLGFTVIPIRVERLEDIARALRQLGAQMGTETTADTEAARFLDQLEVLRARYEARKPVRVFYQVDVTPAFTVNGDSPISEAIALCGGINVFAGLPRLAMAVNREQLVVTAIDVIVHAERDADAVQAFWSNLPLPASRRPAFIAVDAARIARASPAMLDALVPLCEALDALR